MSEVEITTSQRGFEKYGEPITTTYGHTIDIYESSAASGPHVWMSVEPGQTLDAGCVHLDEDQARAVIARLQAFVDRIPERWAVSGDPH